MSLLRNFAHENRLSQKSQMRDWIRYKGAKNAVGIWITKMQQMANNKRRPSKKEKRSVTKQVRSRVIYTRTDWLIFWPEQKRLCEYEEPGCSRKRKQVGSHVVYIHELTDIYIDLFMHMWTGAGATKRGIGIIEVGEHEDLALFFSLKAKNYLQWNDK